jgi:predicted transglutaminase-like cysteine proteinase
MSRRITLGGGAFALVLALLPGPATAEPKPYLDEGTINVALSHPSTDPSGSREQPWRGSLEEPFVARHRMRPNGPLWTKWSAVMADVERDNPVIVGCREAGPECSSGAARRIGAIVDAARAREGRARIGEINRSVNLAIRPQDDLVQHGIVDRWTAPLSTFAAGRGDCEDYALAKIVLLREAGVPAQNLRFVIVAEKRNPLEHHAVAAVRHEGRWLILDNRTLTLADAAALDVEPLFVLRAEPEPAALAESGPQDPGASGPAVAGGSVAGNVPLLI